MSFKAVQRGALFTTLSDEAWNKCDMPRYCRYPSVVVAHDAHALYQRGTAVGCRSAFVEVVDDGGWYIDVAA